MTAPVPAPKTGTVVGVLSGWRVNVSAAGSPYYNVPIPQWYAPQVGDTVALDFYNQGQCYVAAVLTDGDRLVKPVLPPIPTVSMQSSAPGGGWTQVSALYSPTGVTANPPIILVPTTYTPPPAAPTVTTVLPVASATWDGYYGGWRTDDTRVRQGTGPGAPYGASGLWFYGAGAFGFLSGHTITSIVMTVERYTSGGAFAGVQLHPMLHTYTSQPGGAPGFASGDPMPPDGIPSIGQSVTFGLPLHFATDLQAGAAAGIGIFTDSSAEYMIARGAGEGMSGAITFTYT